MSTVTGPPADPGAFTPENDPFRHGERHVPRNLADGTVVYDVVPLRQEDLLFPEEWDRHAITEGHRRDCVYLQNVFQRQIQGVEGAKLLGDLRVDWSHPVIRPMGPDVVVAFGVRRLKDWATFNVAAEGATIELIVEVTSPDTRENDLVIKRDLYYQVGVSHYAVVDRHERRGSVDVSVLAFRRGQRAFEEIPKNDRGHYWLEPVKVWLGVEGDRAVCYLPDGTPAPDYADAVAALAEAERRLKEADAELRRLRGET